MTITRNPAEPDPLNTSDPEATLIAEGAPDHDLVTGRQLHLVLGSLMLTLFLASLDQTIVGTALPRITSELNGLNHMAWVVTAYLLTSTASTLIWGKISDLYGRKPMLQAAIVIFLIGSIAAGAASTMGWLIITRGIQGIGGGGLMVLVMAVIADIIPPRERGRYAGAFGGVFAISSVLGPLAGGWFVDNLSWRWIFYINLPLGIAAFFVLAAALKVPARRTEHSVDYLGAALMVSGVVLLLLVTEWGGGEYEWLSPTIIGMSVASLALLAAFVVVELRVPEPLVPMTLFKNKVFGITSIVGFILGVGFFGALIFLPMYLQIVKGSSPTVAGLQMIPMTIGMLIATISSGRIISRIGRYKPFPILGTGLAAFSMWLMSHIAVDTPYWQIAATMVLLGMGMGNVMQVLILAVQNSVHPREMGVATSGSTFFRSIGGTFGTTIFGAIMTNTLASKIIAAMPESAQGTVDVDQMTNAMSTISQLPDPLKGIVLQAFSDSLALVFLVGAPVMLAGFVFALMLPDVRMRGEHAAAPTVME